MKSDSFLSILSLLVSIYKESGDGGLLRPRDRVSDERRTTGSSMITPATTPFPTAPRRNQKENSKLMRISNILGNHVRVEIQH